MLFPYRRCIWQIQGDAKCLVRVNSAILTTTAISRQRSGAGFNAPRDFPLGRRAVEPAHVLIAADGQISDLPVNSFYGKYSCFQLTQISCRNSTVSSLNEGRIAIVTDVGMGCGGRGSVGRASVIAGRVSRERSTVRRRTALKRTAKPCGPGTRCWC